MSHRASVLLSLLLLFVAVWFVRTYVEFYEEEVDLGWSDEALWNPYLAAQRYLEGQGVNIQVTEALVNAEGLTEAENLLISDMDLVPSARHFDKILSWVEGGGHLITEVPRGTEDNLIYDNFGVYLVRTDYKYPECVNKLEASLGDTLNPAAADESAPGTKTATSEEGAGANEDEQSFADLLREANEQIRRGNTNGSMVDCEYPQVSESDFTAVNFVAPHSDGTETLKIHFPPAYGFAYAEFEDDPLQDESTGGVLPRVEPTRATLVYEAGSTYGYHFEQLDFGQGRITLVSDVGIWRSSHIAEHDHAHLLWRLTGRGGATLIMHGQGSASLLAILWAAVPELILTLLLWLTLWLVFRGRRFGPLQHWQQQSRRSLVEHVHASSRFLWRSAEPSDLLQPLRDDIHRAAQRSHRGYAALSAAEQVALLSAQCGLPESDIDHALHGPIERDEDAFVDIVSRLQTLKASL